jgi:hypothetical protein
MVVASAAGGLAEQPALIVVALVIGVGLWVAGWWWEQRGR